MSDAAVGTVERDWAAFVALDWGSQKHAWSLQVAGDKKREQGFVDNTPEAVAAWAALLNQRFGGRPVAVALEQKRGSVVNLLAPYAHLVLFPVPPSMSSSYRKTFVPSGAKDDPDDADWILDLLLLHRDRLRRLEPDDEQTRLLLFLAEAVFPTTVAVVRRCGPTAGGGRVEDLAGSTAPAALPRRDAAQVLPRTSFPRW